MPVAGLVVADDGVVPVRHVQGAVRPHPDLDRPEHVAARLDDGRELCGGEEAVLEPQLVLFENVGVIAANDRPALHFTRKMAAVQELEPHLLDGGGEKVHRLGVDRQRRSHQARGRVPCPDVRTAFVEGLSVFGGDHPPAVRAGRRELEERVEVAGPRAPAPDPRAVQCFDAGRRFHPGVDVVPLREPEFAAEPPVQPVDHLVRVGGAEPAQDDPAGVGPSVAIGVAEMQQFGALRHVEPAVSQLDPGGHEEVLGELVELVRPAVPVGVLANQHVVPGLLPRLDLRIARRAGHPEPAALVPAHLQRLDDAV